MFLLRPVFSCSYPQVDLEICFEGVEGFTCLNDIWQGIPHFGGIGAKGIESFVCAEPGLNVICCTTSGVVGVDCVDIQEVVAMAVLL